MALHLIEFFAVNFQRYGHIARRLLSNCRCISVKLSSHSHLDFQAKIPNLKSIPLTPSSAVDFIHDIRLRELSEDRRPCSIASPARNLSLLSFQQLRKIWSCKMEAQLSVEPEGTRFDCLFVVKTELVWVDGKTFGCACVTKHSKDLSVDPCGLAIPKRVERVEPDFHL